MDDAALSSHSASPSAGDPFNPKYLSDILPPLYDKGIQLPVPGEPIIREQDFLLPPGENAGILSTSVLLGSV